MDIEPTPPLPANNVAPNSVNHHQVPADDSQPHSKVVNKRQQHQNNEQRAQRSGVGGGNKGTFTGKKARADQAVGNKQQHNFNAGAAEANNSGGARRNDRRNRGDRKAVVKEVVQTPQQTEETVAEGETISPPPSPVFEPAPLPAVNAWFKQPKGICLYLSL